MSVEKQTQSVYTATTSFIGETIKSGIKEFDFPDSKCLITRLRSSCTVLPSRVRHKPISTVCLFVPFQGQLLYCTHNIEP